MRCSKKQCYSIISSASASSQGAARQKSTGLYGRDRDFDPRGRSDTSLFVRFAPKATFTTQDMIRRFVP
jgi:hypothetical protein